MTTSINFVQMEAHYSQNKFCLMKQNSHNLPESIVPLFRSENLSGKCAKLHTVVASNNRDHKITFLSPLVSTI